jgi:hypothetical protein
MTGRRVDPAVVAAAEAAVEAEAALRRFQDDALGRIAEGRRNHPHDDACPHCGSVAWDIPGDPQQCGACGTRICPVCGADFAEEYTTPEHDRITDCLGDHIRQWHAGVVL